MASGRRRAPQPREAAAGARCLGRMRSRSSSRAAACCLAAPRGGRQGSGRADRQRHGRARGSASTSGGRIGTCFGPARKSRRRAGEETVLAALDPATGRRWHLPRVVDPPGRWRSWACLELRAFLEPAGAVGEGEPAIGSRRRRVGSSTA
jgi:hypothetical protein